MLSRVAATVTLAVTILGSPDLGPRLRRPGVRTARIRTRISSHGE
jgi:hypothetical protein